MVITANTMIEYCKTGDQMNDNAKNTQAVINALLSHQEDNKRHDKSVSLAPKPHTMMIGDTTVHLCFTDSGDLHTRLANAFQTMLNS